MVRERRPRQGLGAPNALCRTLSGCKGHKKRSIGKSETRSPSSRRLGGINFIPFHENCLHNSFPHQCGAHCEVVRMGLVYQRC
jgi:hypothetical protein